MRRILKQYSGKNQYYSQWIHKDNLYYFHFSPKQELLLIDQTTTLQFCQNLLLTRNNDLICRFQHEISINMWWCIVSHYLIESPFFYHRDEVYIDMYFPTSVRVNLTTLQQGITYEKIANLSSNIHKNECILCVCPQLVPSKMNLKHLYSEN